MKAIIISGFRKCGTSTIYTWLNDGMHAFGSENYKEPQYFCNVHPDHAAAEQFYRGLYAQAPGGVPWLDGSTLMMSDPESFRRSDVFFGGDLKVVLLIRDPARRMISAYFHMRGKGGREERRDLDTVLGSVPDGLAADDLAAAEDAELHAAVGRGEIQGDYLGDDYLKEQMGVAVPFRSVDPLWNYRYFGESLYARHIAAIRSLIPAERLGVFVMEEVFASDEARRKLADFLNFDVAALKPFAEVGVVNKGYMKGRFGALEKIKQIAPVKGLLDRLPKSFKAGLKDKMYSPLPKATREQVARAREILACEYGHWRDQGLDVDRLWK